MYTSHFLFPFIHQWTLGCFCLLVIVTNAAISMGVQISLRDPAFNFLDKIPRGGITGSYGSSIFNFLRTFHIFFYRGCTILHPHQQWMRVLISLYPLQCLFSFFFFFFLIMAILIMSMMWMFKYFWGVLDVSQIWSSNLSPANAYP